MRLPDFSTHVGLNRLRQQMRAELISWRPGLHWENIDVTLVTTGIEIPPDEIEYAPDGTLEYKGRKVVVYIRDQYRSRDSDPEDLYRFHVADCTTLRTMKQQNRYARYVAASRRDGRFKVNLLGGFGNAPREERAENIERRLYICKHCLERLNYRAYRRRPRFERDNIWRTFLLTEYFEKYDSEISDVPEHTEISDPPNEYAPDQNQISRDYRARAGWTCQACFINLRERPEFLDVHHRNGRRNDNTDENLVALCVSCHTEEPQHQHMESMPRYRKFQQWINELEDEVE